ncbi:hypothetical protein [Actinomycetospora sp. TBRC 11914]|uniref:hypothetical protein n=1 Tax=Actinomycetospora sp. TBRC 11914 TaxID=2729387 RepID=UPI00145E9CE3|nr:hypothetical protein [Actinomycetospora sp. TBRC 11914]NMO93171.1 hypothetical protein [Actinomycetospora sp. TBRC 11914]
MDDGFATHPGELAAAAGPFDEAAGVVAEALAALRTTLDGLGDYVGGDEQGRAFAAQYDPEVAEATAAVDHEARAVRSLGDALRGSAHDYAAGDGGLAGGP